MASENVEALRRLYAEWEKGNMWALRDVADPDIAWEWSEGLATISGGPRVYQGLEEIGGATLEWLEAWDFYWMTADDFVETGDRVLVPMQIRARMAGSDMHQNVSAVWTFRDARVVHVRYYDDPGEAALSLSRPADLG